MLTGTRTRKGGGNHPISLSTKVYGAHSGQKGLGPGARRRAAEGSKGGSERCALTNHRPKDEISAGPAATVTTRTKISRCSLGILPLSYATYIL